VFILNFEIFIAGLGSVLLLWAAVTDYRTRKIPVVAGFGMLGLGLAVLIIERELIPFFALYYLLAIWCTRGGAWQYVLLAASAGMVGAFGWDAGPLVGGVLFVSYAFWNGWFGGGDSQLAFGLIGIGHDWFILGMLFGLTILLGVFLTIKKQGGVKQGMQRLLSVARRLGEEPDDDAIRTSWGIVAAIAGLSYLWFWALVL
jgi:hypothetical protein